ncbi:MAG: hypothetical protein JO141_22995 [Bradyrhizobium sp.]|nr:hypothetical protein [Bradyrhizobium sp.]
MMVMVIATIIQGRLREVAPERRWRERFASGRGLLAREHRIANDRRPALLGLALLKA